MTLADRVEMAGGPDRELDRDIHEALGNCTHRETEYYCIEDGNDTDSGFTCKTCGKDTYGLKPWPAYSASIDTAMSLVPEGWNWRIDHQPVPVFPGAPDIAIVWQEIGRRAHNGNAATPALALCAASLRARYSSEQRNG